MRTIAIITAASVLALSSLGAGAQTTTTPRPGATAPTATTAPAPRPAVNPLTREVVSDIEGTAVYGSDNDKLGHISEVLMDPQGKKIDRLVVSAGGVLGIGSHRVAIPVDQFKWDEQKGAFALAMTTASLKSQPEWVDGDTTMTGSSQPPSRPAPSTGAGDSK